MPRGKGIRIFVALSLVAILPGTVADRTCIEARPPLNLPDCTDRCLKSEMYDGTCADNIRGFCTLSLGIPTYFGLYSKCLMDSCKREDDRKDFMARFEEQCSSAKQPITSIEGPFSSYLQNQQKTRTGEKTGNKPPSTQSPSRTAPATTTLHSTATPKSSKIISSPPIETSTQSQYASITSPQTSAEPKDVEPAAPTAPPPPPVTATIRPSETAAPPSSHNRPQPGVIAAISAGGTIGLAGALIGFLMYRRRRQRELYPPPMVDSSAWRSEAEKWGVAAGVDRLENLSTLPGRTARYVARRVHIGQNF